MKIKSLQIILPILLMTNSILANNLNEQLLTSENLLEYSIKAYHSNDPNIPYKFPASASDFCYNQEDKPLEARANGCHASFLLQFVILRDHLDIIENARNYALSITAESLHDSTTFQSLTKYNNALDRIRTSINTMVWDGFEAVIDYSRMDITNGPIDEIGILIAQADGLNRDIMKTLGWINHYLEILDRKRH